MALFASNIITSDSALGSAKIQKSLRFNDGDTAYLQKGVSSAGNRKTFTYSVWCKRTESSSTYSGNSANCLFYQGDTDGNEFGYITFNGEDKIEIQIYDYPTNQGRKITSQRFRDPNAWYHIVFRVDTTNSTANDRIRLYVNGGEVTDFVTNDGTTSQNLDTWFNDTTFDQYIGKAGYNNLYMDGYLAEIHFVDGSSLDPSSFGFTDPVTSIWMPKRYEGTYGTNGFYLDFADNSSTAALGIDKSPNGNDWTPNNFSVSAGSGNDSMLDTPTNNFPTLSSVDMSGNALEDANLQGGTAGTSGWRHTRSTVPLPSTGKWYWEYKVPDASADGSNGWMTGIAYSNLGYTQDINSNSTGLYGRQTENKYNNSSSDPTTGSHFSTVSNNDILQYAYNADSQTLFTGRNNTWELSANPVTGANPNWTNVASGGFPMVGSYGSSRYVIINFGQQGFSYTPPAGYESLSGNNLPSNAPSIIRPQKHFECVTFTGNGSTGQSITSLDFQPDFIWFKNRSAGNNHASMNSVIGRSKGLYPDSNSIDFNSSAGRDLVSFDPHGFTVGNPEQASSTNNNGSNLVAWCWKAGGATAVSNSDGSITSSVSANPTGGFSIIQYTGTGSAATIGHGLGKTPKLIWVKNRTTTQDWFVNNGMIFNDYGKYYKLNSSQNIASDTNVFPNTAPTSTVFSVGGDNAVNGNGDTYVAYVWSEIPGFSQFGYWTGNGSTNGTYVHTGFTPRLMIYRKAVDENWHMLDTQRSPGNPNKLGLDPNLSNSEATDSNLQIDFLSTGFKMRASHGTSNADGVNYFYYVWAGQPSTTPFDTFPNAR